MRKLFTKGSALAVLALTLAFGGVANAETLTVDSTNFPDESIRKELESQAVKNEDDVYEIDTDNITYLTVSNSVKSLVGVDKLTNLKDISLYSYDGGDIALKLDKLGNLYLNCGSTKTLTVNVPSINGLTVAGGENLQSLDVSANIGLTDLSLSGSVLSTINGLDKLSRLESLDIGGTAITKFDGSTVAPLKRLSLNNMKKLTGVDLSKQTELEFLGIYEGGLTSLDASACTKLKSIGCSGNKLTKLKLPNGINEVYCSDNKLTSLKVPSSVTFLDCSRNKLTSLDVSKCKKLVYLAASDNKIKKINVKSNTKLENLQLNGNKNITSVDISKNTKLCGVNIGYTGIKKLNTSKNKKLTSIYCYNTKVSSLNISKNKNLSNISYYGSKIKKLDLTKYKYMGAYYEVKKGTKLNLKNFIGTGYKLQSKSDNVKYDSKKGVLTVSKKAKKGYYEYASFKKGKKTFWASILITK